MTSFKIPNVLLLHGYNCHFEMLLSFIDIAKTNFNLYLIMSDEVTYLPEYKSWKYAINNYISSIEEFTIETFMPLKNSIQIDYIIINTDDDVWANFMYLEHFSQLPLLVLNHDPIGSRFIIDFSDTTPRLSLNIIGVPTPCEPKNNISYRIDDTFKIHSVLTKFITNPLQKLPIYGHGTAYNNGWSCVWDAIPLSIKRQFISNKISISIIGVSCVYDENFFDNLYSSISNIDDVEIFIITRSIKPPLHSLFNKKLKNIHFLIGIDTIYMFYILSISHYVYFNTFVGYTPVQRLSGQVPLSLSFLNKLILPEYRVNQYGFKTVLTIPSNSSITLNALSQIDLINLHNERQLLINSQSEILSTFQTVFNNLINST